MRRNHGAFLTLYLDDQESDEEDTSEDEEGNYTAVGPEVGRPAPLYGEEEADDCGEESYYSQGVHVLEEGFGGHLDLDGSWDVQKLEEDNNDDGADGQVDVEAACP